MRKRIGQMRVRKGFLFFPKSIYGEMRWLEMAEWQEQVCSGFKWVATDWLN